MSLVDSVPGAHARTSSSPRQVLAIWGSAAGLAAVWAFRKGWIYPAAALALVAILLGLSAIRSTPLIAGVAVKAARFSDVAAEHLSRIILGLWYYLFFTPVALLWRSFRKPLPAENGMWKEFSGRGACSFRKPF